MKPKQNKKIFDYRRNRAWAENLQIVMQVGLTMAGCIVFCFFVGRAIDHWVGIRGLFTALFTVLGVIGGAVVVYRQILEITEEKDRDNDFYDHGSH